MQLGTYGLCETCHDPIEQDRLIADPLIRFCLDHLTTSEQRSLERDLELAAEIQRGLLPKSHLVIENWEAAFHYQPAGPVSGDYYDLIATDDGEICLLFGDVSGKGVAASMLMAQLHAIFRTLATQSLPLDQLVARANALFCASTLANSYATLVCARTTPGGTVKLCNAGHCPPLVVRPGHLVRLEATGLPVGITCNGEYDVVELPLREGENLLFYTDGLTEACNDAGDEYGEEQLSRLILNQSLLAPRELINLCLQDLESFLHGARRTDDLTIMVLQRR
jgi:sigma-B regulation protein RsbU (phosphoserine phosphatase)